MNEEISINPRLGAMNFDDAIDMLPKNHYQQAENLTITVGSDYLRKINGTRRVSNTPGECFGFFAFNDFAILFVHDSSSPSGYRDIIYKIDRVNDVAVKIFQHELDMDKSVDIVDCILIHNETLVFNNAKDEVMKVHIPSSELTVNYLGDNTSTTGFIVGTIGETNGYIHIDYGTGFNSGTDKLYLFSLQEVSPINYYAHIQNYGYLSNYIVEGRLTNGNTRFITNIPSKGGLIVSNNSILFKEYSGPSNIVGYRKKTFLDYYLINTPSLEAPEVSYITNNTKGYNKIRGSVWTFQVKHIYYDNSQSSWSPKSEAIVETEANILDYLKNNGINVSVKHPSLYNRDNVKEVVFGFSKNEGPLYEFTRKPTINPTLQNYLTDINTRIVADFYDDDVPIAVSDKDRVNLFDRVPNRVNGISLIDNSILALGGARFDKYDVPVEASITPIERSAVAPTPTDYCTGYHYQSNGSRFSTGIVNPGGDITYRQVQNINNKGGQIDDSIPVDVDVAYCAEVRNKEAGWNKTFVYFDFSPTQEIGTVYRFEFNGSFLHPGTGQHQPIFSKTVDFVAKTTNTMDLLNEIKTYIDSGSGIHNMPIGNPGDYLESQCFIGTNFGFGATPKSNYSLQIYVGLQCVHNDPGHYHWHQIDVLTAQFTRASSVSFNRKIFKKSAKHPFAIQYYDEFNRIVSTEFLGELDISQVVDHERYHDCLIEIKNLAPPNAVRYQILYAGNKNYKSYIYAVAKERDNTDPNLQKFKIDLDGYNDQEGTNLAYSFTEGDLVQRIADDFSGNWIYLSEEQRAPIKIVKMESDEYIFAKRNPPNDVQDGDLLVISTPKDNLDNDNEIYYEIGKSFPVTNRMHGGDVDQDFTSEKSAATKVAPSGIVDAAPAYDDKTIFRILLADHDAQIFSTDYISIMNSSYKGTYKVFSYYLDSGGTYYNLILDVDYNPNGLSGWTGDIFMTWVGAPSNITSTGVYKNEAVILLENVGDTYLRYRDGNYASLIESSSMSDFYESRYWGKGRPSLIEENQTLDFNSSIYYSEPFYAETLINGLSTVYGSNFETYNDYYGEIKRIFERDDRLIIFHENKVGNILINKSVISTADGQSIVSRSGEVISPEETFYQYNGGIGNQIYSLCDYGNRLYFVDDINREVLRLSRDGITVISEYKMDSYFQEKLDYPIVNFRSYFDRDNYCLVLHNTNENVQILFSERENKWVSFWTIPASHMIYYQGLISYRNSGDAHHGVNRHDNSNKLEIYGDQKLAWIKLVFSDSRRLRKVWKSMMMENLFIDNTNTFPILNEEGQTSELKSVDFRKVGIGFWAAFWRDLGTIKPNPLINGDPLRSKTLTVTLRSNSIDDQWINNVLARYQSIEQ